MVVVTPSSRVRPYKSAIPSPSTKGLSLALSSIVKQPQKNILLKMSQMAYHQEARRGQRVIERKQLCLENLKLQQLARLEQDKKLKKENAMENIEKTGTRAVTRANTRLDTRTATATHAAHAGKAFWVPDICQTTTGSTYYRELIPPKPAPLHQWRDLKNRIRHDYNLVPLPFKNEDIVRR